MNCKPLVTISMLTYNQEKYVRDAVRGLLAQTYEPLEIVISDDCSTDKTWEIIQDEVSTYKANGGCHQRIVLNRNPKNLGLAKHSAYCSRFRHGVLGVGAAGDDISLPCRVEKIVEAWENSGRKATLITHNVIEIDIDGRQLGARCDVSSEKPFGAAFTYAVKVGSEFAPLKVAGYYEDVVYSFRALMVGDEVNIDEPLMLYRVGSGMSTVKRNWRMPNLKTVRADVCSARQNLIDLAQFKDRLSIERYTMLYKRARKRLHEGVYLSHLYGGSTFRERFAAFRVVRYKPFFRPGAVMQLLCLLPHQIGDPLLNTIWAARQMLAHIFQAKG